MCLFVFMFAIKEHMSVKFIMAVAVVMVKKHKINIFGYSPCWKKCKS